MYDINLSFIVLFLKISGYNIYINKKLLLDEYLFNAWFFTYFCYLDLNKAFDAVIT